ncbi:MAG: hypothetical protein WCB67_07710 [Solirubrobacteraceae bacterium]
MTTTHRITTGIVVALAVGASAAPASARPFDLNSVGSYVPAGSASMQAAAQLANPSSPTIVRIIAGNGGFHWDDAGIGAAGGLALSMVGLGGGLAVSQRRTRRAGHTTALTS